MKEGYTSTMQTSKIIMVLFFLAGLALLGVMVWQVGLVDLLESFGAMGPWIAPYLLLRVIPICVHAAGWAACFPGCRLSLWQLVLVGRAGSAINQVTPTATIGGEMVKVLLLEPAVPREQAMAAVVIDKASTALAKMFYLALGMLYLAQHLPLPGELQLSLSLTIGLISLGLIGFVVFQRYGALSKLVQYLGRLKIGQEWLQRLNRHLVPLDTQLMAYYTRYPWRFVRSLLLHFVAYTFDALKTYILLRLLLGASAPTIAEAIMVAVAVAALDQMFFFVPGRIGTLEGARFLVLSGLGVAQIYGLAFGLIARVEHLVWSGVGMLAYAWCTRFSSSPVVGKPQEVMPDRPGCA
jgi:uncharacterized protein (TIRG00374 family)